MIEDEVYEATNQNGNSVNIDMRKAELKKGQSPTELLLSSLAGCGAVDIVIMLKKRRKTIQSFTIETEGNRRDDPPRYFTDIHCNYIVVSPDVTEEELYKTAKLALEKYCSVASSLKSNITFSVSVVRP
ncbi:MAG: OsmC family protein [Bacteroidia bacterium]|nr:OsmC family protein [Bacteroidia bacterium]